MLHFQQQEEIKKITQTDQCNIKNKQLGALIPPLHLCHPILSPHINSLYSHPPTISLCPLTPCTSLLLRQPSIHPSPHISLTHPLIHISPSPHQTLSSFPPHPVIHISPSTIHYHSFFTNPASIPHYPSPSPTTTSLLFHSPTSRLHPSTLSPSPTYHLS
ncbi:hypothetical protein Pcinc_006400 [Petrolisthes cinctipes]|uniref:Uncharacterized protein n=1 Tax=Petrolisthes cinctipes TaxID=88211 RepID=A0AAE1GD07_PETCI|nr:hypothetical protein Pcinc_006400 [Petrolisthes cinctipes]